MGYEFFEEKIIFPSAPVPGINNDQSLILQPLNLMTFGFSVSWTHFGLINKIDPPEGLLQLLFNKRLTNLEIKQFLLCFITSEMCVCVCGGGGGCYLWW